MAIDHDRRDTFETEGANPRGPASTNTPGSPETHNEKYTTWQRLRTRWALGATALVLAAGAAVAAVAPRGGEAQQEGSTPEQPAATTEQLPRGDFDTVPRVFDQERTRSDLSLPETLSPPTFGEAFANIGQALEFYVNTNNHEGISRIAPGTTDGFSLQPDIFDYRADYIDAFRRAYDTDMDKANHVKDPENNSGNYTWGFRIEMLEQLSSVGADPTRANAVKARVRMTIGDYRPSFDGRNSRRWVLEKPTEIEAIMTLTRYTNIVTAGKQPDNGWLIYQTEIPAIPPAMAQDLLPGYQTVPKAYRGQG